MSTSCKVIFNENEFINGEEIGVYIHSDGYPEAMIPLLIEFLNCNGAKKRHNDINYLTSYLTTFMILRKHKNIYKSDLTNLSSLDDFLSVGVTVKDCVVDYEYIIVYEGDSFVIYICQDDCIIDEVII